jgi:hypothetical protein
MAGREGGGQHQRRGHGRREPGGGVLVARPGGESGARPTPRRVYAGVLADWLGLPGRVALGGNFERLPLFRG